MLRIHSTLVRCEYFVHITSWLAYLWNGEWNTFRRKHIKGRGERRQHNLSLWKNSGLKVLKQQLQISDVFPAHPTEMVFVFLGHTRPLSASKGIRKNRWAMAKAPALSQGPCRKSRRRGVPQPNPGLHFLLTLGKSESCTQEGQWPGR